MKARSTPKPRPSSSRGSIVFGILFTIVAVSVWFAVNRDNLKEFQETYKNRENAKTQIALTKQRIAQLKRQQQSLAFNGMETEKQIRERLQYHKPGEKVVFFIKENSTTKTTIQTTGTPQNQPNTIENNM